MPKSQYADPKFLLKKGKITFKDIDVNVYNKTIAEEKKAKNFTDKDLMRIFHDMAVIREFETMLYEIKTQNQYNGVEYSNPGPAHLSTGQEASAVGEAYLLNINDYTFGSHRSHGEILAKGMSSIHKLSDKELMNIMESFSDGKILKALEKGLGKKIKNVKELALHFLVYGTVAEIFARETGFHRGLGGSMHAFFTPFGIYPNNAIVGGSAPIALGAALFKRCNAKDGIVVCNIGDGSLGCGPVWEAIMMSCMDQITKLWEDGYNKGLPLVFNIFNNQYGMGGQTRGETMGYDFLARLGAVTPNQMFAERVNGYDPLAVIDAYRRKKAIIEKEGGPVLLDVVTYRYAGHSPSDSSSYRTKEEIQEWEKYDVLETYSDKLIKAKVAKKSEFDEIRANVKEFITNMCRLGSDLEISPRMDVKNNPLVIEDLMFSNEKIAKMSDDEVKVLGPKESSPRVQKIAKKERWGLDANGKPISKVKAYQLRDGLFEAIIDKFYEDPTLITYGEDIRDWGGAYAVYQGLTEVIPYHRLFNSPISEAAIVGSACGYGMTGGRVIAELMYCDFLGRAGDEVFNQIPKWQAMSAGVIKMPVVIRVSVGSKYGAQHSQDWSSLISHVPGIKVIFPATPYDAKGLMTSALNGTDPVICFESQRIYDKGEEFHEGGVPVESYEVPIGVPDVKVKGDDVTILTIGATLYKAVEAAKKLKAEYGISAEVIDARSLVPFDYDVVLESVKKTGKLVVASDACERGSYINTIAQTVTELAFDYLDAPVAVVGARNWITPCYELDSDFFPQASWIMDAIHEKIMPLPGYTPECNFTPLEKIRREKLGV